jgi:hypothetical protein
VHPSPYLTQMESRGGLNQENWSSGVTDDREGDEHASPSVKTREQSTTAVNPTRTESPRSDGRSTAPAALKSGVVPRARPASLRGPSR